VLNDEVCIYAAQMGHLSCLQYAHESGAPWDARTTLGAASTGQLHCLHYLYAQGCPWGAETYIAATSKGFTECAQFVADRGCPKVLPYCPPSPSPLSQEEGGEEGKEGEVDSPEPNIDEFCAIM